MVDEDGGDFVMGRALGVVFTNKLV